MIPKSGNQFSDRIKSRWVRLGLLGGVVVAAAISILSYTQFNQFSPTHKFSVCPEASLVACLADIAADEAVRHVPDDSYSLIAENLARSGKSAEARRLAQGLKGPFGKESIESAIAIFSIAASARAHPNDPVSLDQVERLYTEPRAKEIGPILTYSNLARTLAGTRPFDVGSTADVVAAVKTAPMRGVSKSVALDSVLKRLREIVEDAPVSLRRWRYADLGRVLIACGELEAARIAFTKATEAPLGATSDVSLIRGWLELDEFDQAIQLVKGVREGSRSITLEEIVNRFLQANRIDEGRDAVDLAWQSAVTESNQGSQFETLRRLVKLTLKVDGSATAITRGGVMLDLANEKRLLKEFDLTTTAAVFNDLGEIDRAKTVLDQARASIPPSDKTFAVGFHLGPISYDRNTALADQLFAAIAVEAFRVGDEQGARNLLTRVGFEPRRNEALAQILVLKLDCEQISQGVQQTAGQTFVEAKFNLLTTAAAACMIRGHQAQATSAMEQALLLDDLESPNPLYSRSLDIARLSDAMGRTDLVKKALNRAGYEGTQIEDRNVRTNRLSTVAALASDMLRDIKPD